MGVGGERGVVHGLCGWSREGGDWGRGGVVVEVEVEMEMGTEWLDGVDDVGRVRRCVDGCVGYL